MKLFSETIDSITERYNSVVETIDAPSDYKFLDGTKYYHQNVLNALSETYLHNNIIIVINYFLLRVQNEYNAVGIEKNHCEKEKRYDYEGKLWEGIGR